jgi:hypothetical protein
MFFRPIRDKIENLRRMIQKVQQTRGAASRDVAEVKRLMAARIAELELKDVTESSEAPRTRTPRRAA